MKKVWDVIIIGSGLAGYVAANYLGRSSDCDILLLDREKNLGGRAKTNIIENHYFNLGPHAFYKKGIAKKILDELGIELKGSSPNTNGILYKREQEYKTPFSLPGILTTNLLSWSERLEWIRVIGKIKYCKIEDISQISFEAWVKQTTRSTTIQSLLFTLARLSSYCNTLNIMSARVTLSHLKLVLRGVLYLDYGWQSIIDQLHKQASTHGVHIFHPLTVKQISSHHDFLLVETNHFSLQSKYVLYTGKPQGLSKLTHDTTEDHFLHRITPLKAASLDIAVTTLPRPHHLFAMDLDESFYYSVHSRNAILTKNTDNVIIHVLKYLSPDEPVNIVDVKTELEAFLEINQPGWKRYTATSRYLPSITVNQRYPKIGDEDYISQPVTTIPNLYVAGDWAASQYILSEAAISTGRKAAEEILEELDANK